MVRIGTSGYNHRDWIGSFYPADMGPARYLARYGEEFDLCELAVAVHRTPAPDEAHRILDESEGRLLFTVLAPRALLSLFRSAGGGLPQVGAGFLVSDGGPVEIAGRDYACREAERAWGSKARAAEDTASIDGLLARLREGLLPYAQAGRFGGLVLPLPRSVQATEASLATIARYCDRLEDLPLLVEPREASWGDERVVEHLRGLGVGFVLADGPEPEGPSFGPDRGGARPLPARRHAPFAPVTAPVAYVRFHGRDGETRWAGGAARRDYLYSWEELVGWLPSLRALASRARELCIVFNNPWRGRAIENAQMLRRLIGPVEPREADDRPGRRTEERRTNESREEHVETRHREQRRAEPKRAELAGERCGEERRREEERWEEERNDEELGERPSEAGSWKRSWESPDGEGPSVETRVAEGGSRGEWEAPPSQGASPAGK